MPNAPIRLGVLYSFAFVKTILLGIILIKRHFLYLMSCIFYFCTLDKVLRPNLATGHGRAYDGDHGTCL